MAKLGIRSRRWLKAFHVFFSMTWIGAGLAFVAMLGIMTLIKE
jgi:hypothetical protein